MKILKALGLANYSGSYTKRKYPINNLITRLIVTDIAPLTVLFCNCPLFVITRCLKILVSIQRVCRFRLIKQ